MRSIELYIRGYAILFAYGFFGTVLAALIFDKAGLVIYSAWVQFVICAFGLFCLYRVGLC